MKNFQLGDFTINVSDELELYNSIRIKYKKLAQKSKDDFLRDFNLHFSNMDQLHNCASIVLKVYIDGVVNEAIQDLVSYKVFDMNDEQFYTEWVTPILTWDQDFDKIDDKYMAIVLNAEEMEKFRTARNAIRSGGVAGGGFGVEGAAIGIGVAVVANAAFAIVRGLTDFTGKAISSVGDALKKNDLYNHSLTRGTLANSLYRQVFYIHLALIAALASKKKMAQSVYISKEGEDRAQAIVDNISKDRIPAEDVQAAIVYGINNNPYNTQLYLDWLGRFGDPKMQLSAIAAFFDITEVNDSKNTLLLERENELSFSTVKFCEENLPILEAFAEYLGYDDFGTHKERLTKIPLEFSGKTYSTEEEKMCAVQQWERTVDGKVFDTPVEAEKEREKSKLDFLYGLVIFFSAWPALLISFSNYTEKSKKTAYLLAIPNVFFGIIGMIGIISEGTRRGESVVANILIALIVWIVWAAILLFIRGILLKIANILGLRGCPKTTFRLKIHNYSICIGFGYQ